MKNQILQMKYDVSRAILRQNKSGKEYNKEAKSYINDSLAFATRNIFNKLRLLSVSIQKALFGRVVS